MKRVLSYFLFVVCLLMPMMLFAQEAVQAVAESAPFVMPEWAISLVQFLSNVPYVGPVIVFILKWGAVLAAVLTAISAFIQGICAILIATGSFVGAQKFSDKVKAISDKILPWFKYISMFNVQKKK